MDPKQNSNRGASCLLEYLDLAGGVDTVTSGALEAHLEEIHREGTRPQITATFRKVIETEEEEVWRFWKRKGLLPFGKGDGKDANAKNLAWRVWFIKKRRESKGREEKKGRCPSIVPDKKDCIVEDNIKMTGAESHLQNCMPPFMASVGLPNSYPGRKELSTLSVSEQSLDHRDGGNGRKYIVLISMHGFICGSDGDSTSGRRSEVNSEAKYVVDLACALARQPGVFRVDLLTRLIDDPAVDSKFSEVEETLLGTMDSHRGAAIVRIPCGPSGKYLRKEHLWPFIHEFSDNAVEVVKQRQAAMSVAGEGCELYAIHGHHAHGGEVAALMALVLGADMVMTGHSLGRSKLDCLLKAGSFSHREAEEGYNIGRRIEGEERGLDVATVVFTSTQQEIDDGWGMYDGYTKKVDKLDANEHCQAPFMATIAPGFDSILKSMVKAKRADLPATATCMDSRRVCPQRTRTSDPPKPPIWKDITKFLVDSSKPAVLSICDSSSAQNVCSLLSAFGSCQELRKSSNLVLILENRNQIDCMDANCAALLREVLKLVDDFDLYGSVAYPKKHTQGNLSDIYTFVANTQGVYVHDDSHDPFRCSLIESAAHGIPIVAMHRGNPLDLVATLGNGVMVDMRNAGELEAGILEVVTSPDLWRHFQENGLMNLGACSWDAHCKRYLETVEAQKRKKSQEASVTDTFIGSWDNRVFELITSRSGIGELDPLNNDLINMPEDLGKILGGEEINGIDWGDYVVDGEPTQQPRISTRKSVCAFSFDNQASARTVLEVLRSVMKALPSGGGVVGLGLISMLGFNPTCSLVEQAGIDLDCLDFIVCSSGVDLFVWVAGEMVFYDPFDKHVGEYWDKATVQKLLDCIPNGSGTGCNKLLKPYKDVHGSSDFGPNHIMMELSKGAEPSADEVSLSDLIKRRIRRAAVRANIVLQVDESPRGATTAPIVHVTPMRACRSQALRFLMCDVGIPMSEVTIVCCATSLMESGHGQRRRVGFAVSDMGPALEGSQSVVVIPPNKETQVREPKDGLDAKMIEKLKYEIGRKLYLDRVMMIGKECGVLGGAIGATLASGDVHIEELP